MDLRLLIPFTEESASILVTRHTNSFQKYESQNAPERMCMYGRGCGDSEEARRWQNGVGGVLSIL